MESFVAKQHPQLLKEGRELAYVGHTSSCSRQRHLDVFPGAPYKFEYPQIPFVVRPLEGIIGSALSSANVTKWQHSFHVVGKEQARVYIYWTRFSGDSGKEEYELVQRLSTILQGNSTAPERSKRGYVYLIYTPTIVAQELRKCCPIPAHMK